MRVFELDFFSAHFTFYLRLLQMLLRYTNHNNYYIKTVVALVRILLNTASWLK